MEQERHIAAQAGGEPFEHRAFEPAVPQRIRGHQRRGRVGAAAGQPTTDRDPLAQGQVRGRLDPRQRGDRPNRLNRQVVVAERHALDMLTDQVDTSVSRRCSARS